MNKNLLHTIATSLLLCAGLVSCEMKDELTGNMGNSSEVGYLDLGVAVNGTQNVITKADEVTDGGEQTGSTVSAADFPVLIKGVTDPTYEKSFAHFSEIESPIELPVGTYAVSAHSDLELQTQMSVPYYEGTTKNNLVITKDVESKADVICKMKNTRIQLNYTDQFTANFTEWTILFDDGKNNTLTFKGSTSNASNPAPVYWLISENVSNITIHVEATNLNGDKVTDSRVLTKPAGSGDSDYWTGGDALNVEMNGVKPDPENPTGVTGIEIKVDVTFDEEEESVEVPVTPGTGGGDEPNPGPGDDEPDLSMTLPGTDGKITYTLNGSDMPSEANVVINAPKGIKSLVVKIKGGNDAFTKTLGDLNTGGEMSLDFINAGVEMVDNDIISSVLAAFLQGQTINAPAEGATSYSFPIHAFFGLMNGFGATAPNSHIFTMILEDMEGNKMEESLSVTINPAN